jgi:tripartite-type tricarboxylate transporter receptor subunit TctC
MLTAASRRSLVAVALASCLVPSSILADPVADFYRGNTIKLYVAASPGGTYDLVARLFVKHFASHVPGRPTVIVMNMPGAMGVPNFAANVAARDGTVIGLPNATVPMNQLVTPQQVRYDVTKFNWIGNLEQATGSIFTFHTSPTKTIHDAKTRETVMGVPARSGLAYQYLALSNKLLSTKFKIIAGYERNRVIAIERGELEGSATTIQNFAGLAPHWMPNNLINILTVYAQQRLPRLPNAPTMIELTDNPLHRKMLEFMMLQSATARAVFAPPDVPAERVEALRRAFDKTARDPEFLAETARHQIEIDPSTGEQTQNAVARLIATSPEIVAMVLEAVN